MKKIILIILILLPLCSIAQVKKDSLLIDDGTFHFYINGKHYCQNFNIQGLFCDSVLVDSSFPKIYKNDFRDCELKGDKLFCLFRTFVVCFNLKNNAINTYRFDNKIIEPKLIENYKIYGSNLYLKTYNLNTQKVSETPLLTEEEEYAHYNPTPDSYNPNFKIRYINKLSNEKFLYCKGEEETGAYVNLDMRILDLKTAQMQSVHLDNTSKYLSKFYDEYEHGFQNDPCIFRSIDGKYFSFLECVMDNELNIIGGNIGIGPDQYQYVRGFVVENSKPQYYIVSDHRHKLILFDLDPKFCNLMYKVYYGEKISKDELNGFDEVDLKKLRNTVYAKYNYKFDDQYLDAYFNWYDFYYCHEPRVTEVESKFTDADKYNLSVLESVGKVYGLYPEASQKKLTKEYLQKFNNSELKIMRNEVFARHGYIFRQGGEMDKYFRLQPWYKPLYPNVDKYFSDIEKYNISLILSIEKSRN